MIMPDIMTSIDEDGGRVGRAEVLGVQRRRRWTPQEKVRIVDQTYLPGHSVSLVARRHGIAANQLFAWRRLMAHGALTAAGSRRGSCAGLAVPGAREPGARAAASSWQEDDGERGPARGGNAGRSPKKLLLRSSSWQEGRTASAAAAAAGVSRPHLSRAGSDRNDARDHVGIPAWDHRNPHPTPNASTG